MQLCERAVAGDEDALTRLLSQHRDSLTRMIRFRLPEPLKARIGDSDIIQETALEAARCIANFEPDPERPFYLWLRQIAWNKLIEAERNHIGTQKRDATREVPIHGSDSDASCRSMAGALAGSITSPSHAAMKIELQDLLHQKLAEMDEIDREVLLLRHFEQLSTAESAAILGISKAGAGKRYLNALDRLRDLLVRIAEVSTY